MTVLVAGATGAVGVELTRQLRDAGHHVIGITRSDRGADTLRALGAEAVVADVMDRTGLLDGLRGLSADAVIHQATALTRTPMMHRDLDATNALRTQGTANLLAAGRQVGAQRFVTQSFLYGYGYHDHGTSPLTEDAPFGEPGRGAFSRHLSAMRANEQQVLGSSDLEGISLRYGIFYGFEHSTLAFFDQAERGRLVGPRRGGTTSLVHIEDAAAGAVAALGNGRAGHAYNVVDDLPVTWSRFMHEVAVAAKSRPPRSVPNGLLRLSPYLGALMVRSQLALDNGRARRELGWSPRFPTVTEGLADVARRRSP